MPRPMKWRRIAFMPENRYFIPFGKNKTELKEIKLKMEELEAMRLKDIEGLNQSECADLMKISRQTFQLIIDEARKKVTVALTSGMAINITGGNYTYNICKYTCNSCGFEFISAYEKDSEICPNCNESNLSCEEVDHFCKKGCKKKCCLQSEINNN